MLNLIAACLCLIMGIYQYYIGNTGWAILEIIFLLLNLPFVIQWFKKILIKKY